MGQIKNIKLHIVTDIKIFNTKTNMGKTIIFLLCILSTTIPCNCYSRRQQQQQQQQQPQQPKQKGQLFQLPEEPRFEATLVRSQRPVNKEEEDLKNHMEELKKIKELKKLQRILRINFADNIQRMISQ